MLQATVNCYRLTEVSLPGLLGMHGIFTIWDARGEARPSYIGSGNLLNSLGEHFNHEYGPFQLPVDGYVGVVGPQHDESVKVRTRAIRHLLLDVATDLGHAPRVRGPHLYPDALLQLLREDASFRVSFDRFDPLTAPASQIPLAAARTIVAWTLDQEAYWLEHTKMIPALVYRSLEPGVNKRVRSRVAVQRVKHAR